MKKASLGTIFLTVFLDLLGFGLVVPFLPGVARDLGASDLGATLLGSAYSLMQFLFIPFWGRLSDRVGRRPVLLWSIAASVVGMTLLGFANSLVLLFAARLFSGVATANIAVAQAYIADITTPQTRARGMGMIGMAFGLGFILGPFIGGELGHFEVLGRQGPLAAFAAAAASLVNLLFAWRVLPESLPAEKRTDVNAPRRRWRPLDLGALHQVTSVPGVGRSVALSFLVTFFFAGMELTFRLFTEDAFGLTVAQTGRVFGFVGIIAAVVQGGLIGRFTKRYGEVRLMGWGIWGLALGFAGLAASVLPGTTLGLVTLMVACAFIAAGNGLTVPSLSSYTSRRAGPAVQGMTLGVMQSLSALARAFGPFAGGLAYQFIAPWGPYVVGAMGFVLAAVLARGLAPLADHAPAAEPQH
ncbi:MAG: MFS transporter [Deltaproteobacteria bacterium]|nr:MFS transporter [Deltaproteobacteria bacterium]